MPPWPAWSLVVSAGALLVASSVLEYRQRSEQGPVAIVPTLPHAFAAAMLAGLAAAYLRLARSPGFAWVALTSSVRCGARARCPSHPTRGESRREKAGAVDWLALLVLPANRPRLLDWHQMSREFFDELVQHNFRIVLQHACRFAPLSAEDIDELADDCDWRELSANERLPWSTKLVLRHLARWSAPELLANPALAWTEELVEGYGRRLDWHYLCRNPELRLDGAFLERHAKRLNCEQLARYNRHLTPELRERVLHELKGEWPEAAEPVGLTLHDVTDPGSCPLDRSRPVSSLTAEEAVAHHEAINWYKLTPDLLDLTPDWLRKAGVWLHWSEPTELLYRRFIEPHLKPEFATQLRELRRQRAGYYFVNGAREDAWGMIPRLDLLACASESRDPVPARISSYKEGPWRFFDLHWVDEVHGKNCLLIDRRLRPLLQAFQLGKHRFRELDVRSEQKSLPDWLLLEINDDGLDHVVWSVAPCFRYFHRHGWRSHHEIGAVSSKQEWQRCFPSRPRTIASTAACFRARWC